MTKENVKEQNNITKFLKTLFMKKYKKNQLKLFQRMKI